MKISDEGLSDKAFMSAGNMGNINDTMLIKVKEKDQCKNCAEFLNETGICPNRCDLLTTVDHSMLDSILEHDLGLHSSLTEKAAKAMLPWWKRWFVTIKEFKEHIVWV